MIGNAKFQQNSDLMSADTIIYDRANETVTSKKSKNSNNQVKTIINTQSGQN
jgi:lipopolysaccharide export system protein LptA